jgi:nucleotide-binding universal stress UspA family protein
MACIDNSQSSLAVCDGATWASQRLRAPLTLLHVLDQERYLASSDLSVSIGLGSREHLLEELAALDAQRAKLALEQGRHLLETARERITTAGCATSELKQVHGHLAESLSEVEDDIRLLVIGRLGGHSAGTAHRLGSQIETVIRNFHHH